MLPCTWRGSAQWSHRSTPLRAHSQGEYCAHTKSHTTSKGSAGTETRTLPTWMDAATLYLDTACTMSPRPSCTAQLDTSLCTPRRTTQRWHRIDLRITHTAAPAVGHAVHTGVQHALPRIVAAPSLTRGTQYGRTCARQSVRSRRSWGGAGATGAAPSSVHSRRTV